MFRNLLIAATAAGMSFAFAGSANAALKIWLSDGTTTVVVEDDEFAPVAPVLEFDPTDPDQNTTAGGVTWWGMVGSWNVQTTIGLSKPLIGSALEPEMDLFNVSIFGGTGTLTVMITDTDFMNVGSLHFESQIGGTSGGTVGLDVYADSSNAEFGMATSIEHLGPFGPGSFSNTANSRAVMAAPWSLTAVATITHTSSGQLTSFDAVIKVPEPRTLALFGIGLLALGLLGRRRRIRYAH